MIHSAAGEKDQVKLAIITAQANMIMRGQLGVMEPPQNHIIYNHQTRDLFHLYSAKNFGYAFGSKEYSKFLSIKEFLDINVDILDDILEGYGRGAEDLIKQREKAALDAARRNKTGEAELAAIKNANKG